MKTNQAFWDTSAIVPLCTHEPTSLYARQIMQTYPQPVVWWGTWAEARSAFARAARKNLLTVQQRTQAQKHLERLSQAWTEIVPNNNVRRLAVDLLDGYSLRTCDAFQLAAALVWCDEKPRRHTMICFDVRLADAARQVGFTVVS